MSLSDFLRKAASQWMREQGPEGDVVISSRVRLARNLAHYPFPMLATESQSKQVIDEVRRAIETGPFQEQIGRCELIPCADMTDLERQVLVEKHLISPALAEESRNGAVVLRGDETVSIMVNEEDHLRIQCLFPGFQLEEAWKLANAVDDLLENVLDYAYDESRGYLTACPTNVGTGIRASVMMHLPGLVLTNQMNRILAAITQVGLVVRGIYGEGSEAVGHLFQVSNQLTLGQSEMEIIHNLQGVARQIIDHERAARAYLMRESRDMLEDRVCRSYGILSHARKIDSKEAMQRLSDVRLGIDLGIIKGVAPGILQELMVMTQPAFLQKYSGQELSPGERDYRRAALIRERLRLENGSMSA